MSDLFFRASIAVLLFLMTGGLAIRKMQKKRKWYISIILAVSFFVAAYVWCLGALLTDYTIEEGLNIAEGVQGILLALQSTLGVFAGNVSLGFFDSLLQSGYKETNQWYAIYTSFLLAAAPILTVGMILSFFNGVAAFFKIFFNTRKKIFVFSELNQEAISLAKSCKQEVKKALIIFTDVYKDNAEQSAEMLEAARALDAVCVKRDILSLNYFINSKKTWNGSIIARHEECSFFIIGKNDDENIRHASALFEKYYDYSNVKLYLFSESNIVRLMTTAMLKAKNDELQAPIKEKILKKYREELYQEIIEDEARRIKKEKEESKKKTENEREKTQREVVSKAEETEEIKITEEDIIVAKQNIGNNIEERLDDKIKEKYKRELRDLSVKMTIRCYNIKQNVIYNYLYTHNLFLELDEMEKQEKADENKDTKAVEIAKEDKSKEAGTKELSVGVVGSGTYAKELIKALLWYGQMPGYELKVHVFDEGASLKEYFEYECPELIAKNRNTKDGDAKYDLCFHDCGPGSVDYKKKLEEIERFSHLYFMYEEDEKNIDAGIDSKRILKNKNFKNLTKIICLIRSNGKKQILQGKNLKNGMLKLKDYRGDEYDLEFLYEEWDYNFSINRALEEEAIEEHKKWVNDPTYNDDFEKKYGKKKKASKHSKEGGSVEQKVEIDTQKLHLDEEEAKEEFFNYDYNYRSSVTRAIRARIRREKKIGEVYKKIEERNPQEREKQQKAEHIGWNAYMRTEGYCSGENKSARYKIHDCLVCYQDLENNTKKKDVDRQYPSEAK